MCFEIFHKIKASAISIVVSRFSVPSHVPSFHTLATSLRLPQPSPRRHSGRETLPEVPAQLLLRPLRGSVFLQVPQWERLFLLPFHTQLHGKPPPCSMLADLLLISCSSPDFSENCKNQLNQCHPQAQPLEHLEATIEFLCQQHRGSPTAGREPQAGPTLWGVRCLRLENKTVPSAHRRRWCHLSRNRVGRSFSHLSHTRPRK